MKLRLFIIVSCGLAVPGWSQTTGTPLPGLRDDKEAASVPGKPAPPDLPALRKKAEAGDAAAQLQLADLIFSGAVKDAKPAEAAALLEKAADSGHAPAQYAFARLLHTGGPGIKADAERARFLIQQAAEAGHAPAQTACGAFLFDQIDPKARDVNFTEPLAWFKKAADQGEPEAQCRLGMMQAAGQGMTADPAAGWKLILKAARTGNAMALNEAGVCLQQGRGVEKDGIAAIGYFHAAADLGNAAAAVNLGLCYERGQGVPPNFDKAGAAYARGAKAGNGTAQFFLGRLFEDGRGTAKNPVAAYVNYVRAAAAGIAEAAARRDAVKATLTPAQAKEAAAMLLEPPP